MFRKMLLLALLTAYIPSALAVCFDSPCCQRTGLTHLSPYVGINAGINTGSWKVKNAEEFGASTNFPTSGGKGGIFAGVAGRICPGLYLGSEVFINKGSTTSANKVIDTATGTIGRIRSTYDYGLSFIPGYMFSPFTTLYTRMGLIVANSMWTQNPGPNSTESRTTSNTLLGAQFGLGFQTALTTHLNIRIEYDYADYASRTPFGNTIYPQNNQFNLGLFYKFI